MKSSEFIVESDYRKDALMYKESGDRVGYFNSMALYYEHKANILANEANRTESPAKKFRYNEMGNILIKKAKECRRKAEEIGNVISHGHNFTQGMSAT